MPSLIPRDTVAAELRRALAETLQVDEAAVREQASIVTELGAESLDFLDVNYQLEQTFGIRMARRFVLEHAEEVFGEGATIDERGRLTPAAVALLRRRYGDATIPDARAGLHLEDVPALITVGAMADTVHAILDTLPERCACGAASWESTDGTHVACAECGAPGPYATGDELTRAWVEAAGRESGLVPV